MARTKSSVSARCVVPPADASRWVTELADRGRVSAAVPVEVLDETGAVVLSAVVEWFVARGAAGPAQEPA